MDSTVGYGGHAYAILERTAPTGIVVGIDRDQQALEYSRHRFALQAARMRLVHGDYREISAHLGRLGIGAVDGVIFDLGASSAQLDDPTRGFSFSQDGPLDMRMDRSQELTAAVLLKELPEHRLADLFFQYGEERYARRIARAVVAARSRAPFNRTQRLVDVVRGAVPPAYRHGRIHCATRVFQALRIAVNRELEGLEQAFRDAAGLLQPGGRLCIISFHSLEDRIAKHAIRSLAAGSPPVLRPITKKPIVPSEDERHQNPRARSAKLRIAERLCASGAEGGLT